MSESSDPAEEIEDLELCAKEGRKPRCKHRLRIRIDKERHVVNVSHMTGRQLLELAGRCNPERWRIRQKLKGGQLKDIGLDENVDFTAPGIERFITIPLDQTEGRGERREFDLPQRDIAFLESAGWEWELVGSGGNGHLLINRFPVPPGYNHNQVTVALRIEPAYDDAQIDMAYFHPALARLDGGNIRQICQQQIDGKPFQRWSRHRTAQNPWRPGIDYVGTHMVLVEDWLRREVGKS